MSTTLAVSRCVATLVARGHNRNSPVITKSVSSLMNCSSLPSSRKMLANSSTTPVAVSCPLAAFAAAVGDAPSTVSAAPAAGTTTASNPMTNRNGSCLRANSMALLGEPLSWWVFGSITRLVECGREQ